MKVYPKITGSLCANSHPGSYTGQDAFNDMFPVMERNKDELAMCRKRSASSDVHAESDKHIGLYARSANSYRGGYNKFGQWSEVRSSQTYTIGVLPSSRVS